MARKKAKTRVSYQKNDPSVMEQAVKAVQSGALSLRKAAEKFNVHKSTLHDRVTKRVTIDAKPGRKPVLSNEIEKRIIKNVTESAEKGFGISRKQLLHRAAVLCKRNKITGFKNFTPSKHWWEGLKKRHPEVALRKPEKLGTVRARMLNGCVVDKYFADLSKIVVNLNLQEKPENIWNCDETGKQLEHTPVNVIARRGSKSVVGRTGNDRSNITIMACVNATGDSMPPMLIVKGKTKKSLFGFNTAESPQNSVWTYNEKAWMNEELGEQWFREVFLAHCGPERPQLLILDGHGSHETLGLLELAAEENIHILALPPHTTHFLQPLDRTVFGPFNKAYNRVCSEFLSENPSNLINKWTFPKMFSKAWEAAITKENIQSGFRACGIYPLNPHAIPTSAYLPSSAYETSMPVAETPAALGRPPSPSAADNENIPSINMPIPPETESQPMHNATSTMPLIDSVSHDQPTPNIISLEQLPLQTTSLPTTPSSQNFEVDDPSYLLQLINSGEIQVVATADNEGVATLPVDTVWNEHIDAIFSPSVNAPRTAVESKKKSRAITSHRLLTSVEVVNEKRAVAEKKKKIEEEKQNRKLKRDQNKLKREKKTA